MGIGLSIVFSGLCALVTDSSGGAGQVLLVDSKGFDAVGGVTLPEHSPTLVMSLSSLANAETSHPSRVVVAWPGEGSVAEGDAGQVGLWDLTGSEVRVRVEGESWRGLQVFRPQAGSSSWPEPPVNANNPAEWRDLRFLADMNALSGDGRIDPALVAESEGTDRLPRPIAARVFLDGGLVEAGIPSLESYRDDVFEFRGRANEPALRQALTDTIRWNVQTNKSTVVIDIVRVANGDVRRLVLKPSALVHRVFIANLPAEGSPTNAHPAMSDQQMAAAHFGAYYELLRDKPTDRPLPTPWIAPVSRPATGRFGGPFCPPAVFRMK